MATRESARRFHFLREIASGGFGSVYLCKVVHPDGFSRLAAVKLLKTQWSDNEEVVRRIRDEARLLGMLRHRSIVDVMDLTSIDGRTAVVMEYLEAVDLRMVVRDLKEKGDRLPPKVALEICAMVADALDKAYNRPPYEGEKPLRVIHRDIKPSNIMVDEMGVVKVLDFGVARSDLDNRESHTRELQFGSVDYMAPERLFFEPETPASDVYSLTATLYEILALEKLGKARGSPERHAAHLTDRLSFLRAEAGLSGSVAVELEALLRSGLSFEHEGRPTAAAFHQRARALSRLMGGEDLSSWAERLLPPMVARAQSSQQEGSPLSESVLTEDSLAIHTQAQPAPAGSEASPARQVQLGALAELGEEEFSPTPATGAPPSPTRAAIDDAPDLSDWEDLPTRLQPGPSQTLVPEELPPSGPSVSPPSASSRMADVPVVDFDPGASVGPAVNAAPPPPPPPDDLSEPLTDEQPTRPISPEDLRAIRAQSSSPSRRPSAPAPAPPPPTPPHAPAVSPPRGGGGSGGRMRLLAMVALMGCAIPLGLVGVGGLVLALDVGGLRSRLSESGSTGVVVPPPEPPTPPAPPEPPPSAGGGSEVPAGGLVFTSQHPDTRTVRVDCDTGAGKGSPSAQVAVASAGRCTVQVILNSRERLTATVEGPTEGRYLCFAEGSTGCTRE